ncbi:hypothetical protein ACFL59_07360 [Planctomycetota bacterium]
MCAKRRSCASDLRLLLAVVPALLACSGCGFLADARVTDEYVERALPDDERVLLATWPFHLVMITGCATIDQTIRTGRCVAPAAIDAYDFFKLRGHGNNLMFERTVAIPKILVTPLVFVGDYVARWFYPFEDDERPFEFQS